MRYVLAAVLLALSLVAPHARASDTTSTGHPKSLPDGAALHREAENVAAAPGEAPLQEFRLPVELGQGLGYKRGDPGLNYEAAFRVLPTFGYGRWDFSLDLALLYRNASLDAGLGGRVDKVVVVLYEVLALRAGLQADYLPRANDARLSGVIGVGLGGLANLSIAPGWDVREKSANVIVSFGVDALAFADPVGAVLKFGNSGDIGR